MLRFSLETTKVRRQWKSASLSSRRNQAPTVTLSPLSTNFRFCPHHFIAHFKSPSQQCLCFWLCFLYIWHLYRPWGTWGTNALCQKKADYRAICEYRVDYCVSLSAGCTNPRQRKCGLHCPQTAIRTCFLDTNTCDCFHNPHTNWSRTHQSVFDFH